MSILNWNRDFALEQAADDQELLQELIDIFKTSFADDLGELRVGLDTGNSGQVAGAAHSIKGASSSLGMEGIARLAKQIEDDSKNGDITSAKKLLSQLELMLEEVRAL